MDKIEETRKNDKNKETTKERPGARQHQLCARDANGDVTNNTEKEVRVVGKKLKRIYVIMSAKLGGDEEDDSLNSRFS